METDASSFESSEMLATLVASTPLLSDSWRLCRLANTTAPMSFVIDRIGDIGYVAFSAIQTVPASDQNLVPLDTAGNGLFPLLHRHNDGEEAVMVHAGFLQLFFTMYNCPSFQNQMAAMIAEGKSVIKLIITGHSIGGTTASLAALWLLSYLQSISSPISVLCITFGSPLLGNESLSRAILQERWGGNFCHIVSKHDIMPRLLLAPLNSLTPQLHFLLQFWHWSIGSSPQFGGLAVHLTDEEKTKLFLFVLACVESSAKAEEGPRMSLFWPFGNYVFCSEEGGICVENAMAVLKMMHLMFMMGSPRSSIEDHLKYGDYVEKFSMQFLERRSFMPGELPESSYEAGIAFALQSSGIGSQELVARPAKDCLKMARRMGRTPNLNSANLAIGLSKINPYRAEIEWYKASCEESADQMGYYDSFKRREGASKRDYKVNMNRFKLANFWDGVISMLDGNQLPHDFHKRAKWVNGSHSYKLLVEPLDIAEYYRDGMHHTKGHYIKYGRERRYEIFDKWWRERKVNEEENSKRKRSRFASLTQDSCFWARVEEAKEWLEIVRSESDIMKLAQLWKNINEFERYAGRLVESKEVSRDVVLKNSSYSLWVEQWRELKSQMQQFPPQFPPF